MKTKTLKQLLFMTGMLAFAVFYHLASNGSVFLLLCSLSYYSFFVTILVLYLLVGHIKPTTKNTNEEKKQ